MPSEKLSHGPRLWSLCGGTNWCSLPLIPISCSSLPEGKCTLMQLHLQRVLANTIAATLIGKSCVERSRPSGRNPAKRRLRRPGNTIQRTGRGSTQGTTLQLVSTRSAGRKGHIVLQGRPRPQDASNLTHLMCSDAPSTGTSSWPSRSCSSRTGPSMCWR